MTSFKKEPDSLVSSD